MQIQKISNGASDYKTQVSTKTVNKYSESRSINQNKEHSLNKNSSNICFKGLSTKNKFVAGALSTFLGGCFSIEYLPPIVPALCFVFSALCAQGIWESDDSK